MNGSHPSQKGVRRKRRNRVRDVAVETGAAAMAVTGNIIGAGLPPDTGQLDDSKQITDARYRDSIGDASNKAGDR